MVRKNGFFGPSFSGYPRKTAGFPGTRLRFNKMNGLLADPHAAEPPGITVPEALALPVARAVTGTGDIGRRAVIAITRSIIARAVIARTSERAANDCAANNASRNCGANAALGVGRRRRHSRDRKRRDGCESHQHFPHGFTFLIEQRQHLKQSAIVKGSIFRLNVQ